MHLHSHNKKQYQNRQKNNIVLKWRPSVFPSLKHLLHLTKVLQHHRVNKQVGSCSNASDLYLGNVWFKSHSGHLTILGSFVVFLSPSRKITGQHHKIRSQPISSTSFQFIIQYHPIGKHYIVRVTESVIK
jgi:hypothetical protein